MSLKFVQLTFDIYQILTDVEVYILWYPDDMIGLFHEGCSPEENNSSHVTRISQGVYRNWSQYLGFYICKIKLKSQLGQLWKLYCYYVHILNSQQIWTT